MLRLYLLGRLELAPTDREGQAAVLAQPKRLAILAYLAVSAGKYQRRDTLLALFWPELDEFAARRALRNAIYQLRLTLGDAVFVARGDDEIMVDPAALWCDAAALRDAVSAARYDEAIELYRGELLEGFHVSNVGEGFETWLEHERAQALALGLQALDAKVEQYQRDKDDSAAARCALRATALAPFDELWLRRAAMALECRWRPQWGVAVDRRVRTADGDGAGGAAGAETQALIDRLRSGAAASGTSPWRRYQELGMAPSAPLLCPRSLSRLPAVMHPLTPPGRWRRDHPRRSNRLGDPSGAGIGEWRRSRSPE